MWQLTSQFLDIPNNVCNCRYPHTFPTVIQNPSNWGWDLALSISVYLLIYLFCFFLTISFFLFPTLDSDVVSSSNNKDLGVGKNHKYLDIWVYFTLGLHSTWIIMRFVRKLYPPSHLKARSLIFSFIQSPVEQPGRKVVTCWIIFSSWSPHCTGEGQRHLQQFSSSSSIFLGLHQSWHFLMVVLSFPQLLTWDQGPWHRKHSHAGQQAREEEPIANQHGLLSESPPQGEMKCRGRGLCWKDQRE